MTPSAPSTAQSDSPPAYRPLGDPELTPERFGTKAHVLSELYASSKVRVPRGYALDVDVVGGPDDKLTDALTAIAHELESDGRPMIARSSALVEDGSHPLFPG